VHLNARCMEAVSACLMAHVNTAGVHVPLWLDSATQLSNGTLPIGWGVDRTNYPMQEGTFFGDIIDTGTLTGISKPSVTAPVGFYCDGAGYPAGASGVVAGRLGAKQANAPYKNPYGDGALCQNAGAVGQFSNGTTGSCPSGSNSNPQAGCPDGYKALNAAGSVWQNGITVWRNNNYRPVFDAGYIYRIAPVNTNNAMSVDVYGAHTTNGSVIQQWYTETSGTAQMFNLIADGSNWRISMSIASNKCFDLVGSGSSTGNGTQLAINDCSAGDASQQFTITPDAQTGGFIFKNVLTGRCLDENGGNTSAGVPMQVWDCNGGVNQKFNIQAFSSTN